MAYAISQSSEPLKNIDENLIKRIDNLSVDEDYWTFKSSLRKHAHAYYHYPAMMVPEVQGKLIELMIQCQPGIKNVLDPFVGSGTTMTECMFHGLNFVGQDINPLAVLISKTKVGPFTDNALGFKLTEILERVNNDKCDDVYVDFPGLTKWFRSEVAIGLSKLRRSIMQERYLWARRFFWVVLSEVIRLSSNSRTSTYKLHIRPKHELERSINVVELFHKLAIDNINQLAKQKFILKRSGTLNHTGYYGGLIDIQLSDSSKQIVSPRSGGSFDLVVTSPPYGDNKTTVPYGQNAFLPLNWIDFKDIDEKMNELWLTSTSEIDSRSIGGKLQGVRKFISSLSEKSSLFAKTISQLDISDSRQIPKVTSFFKDLDNCVCNISRNVRKNGYMIWTVGNRRVSNQEIPSDLILTQLLENYGVKLVLGFSRNIHSKKMAIRNNISSTIKSEQILVYRKL